MVKRMGNKGRSKFPLNHQRNQQLDKQVNIQHLQVHKGPLPDPLTLEQYDKVVPGAAERILRVFEKQVDHRLDIEQQQAKDIQAKTAIEKEYADSETRIALCGVIFAFIISIISILGGLYMIVFAGHEVLGTLFSGAGLAPLVGNFIRDTRSHHQEQNK
ncbi:DUF2335 domain-containing protein [Mitsuokella sp.]